MENHTVLRVHILKGNLSGRYSFSINYRSRIFFMGEVSDTTAELLYIGDHSAYDWFSMHTDSTLAVGLIFMH